MQHSAVSPLTKAPLTLTPGPQPLLTEERGGDINHTPPPAVRRLPQSQLFPLPHSHTSNTNWSPDSVLLRSRQRMQPTPCDIITGVPLITTTSRRHCSREEEEERKAPLLRMRERRRGGSRLGFGGGVWSTRFNSAKQQNGYHLAAGRSSGLLPGRIDSAYSRHSLIPAHTSAHTAILPDQNPPTSEQNQDRLRLT